MVFKYSPLVSLTTVVPGNDTLMYKQSHLNVYPHSTNSFKAQSKCYLLLQEASLAYSSRIELPLFERQPLASLCHSLSSASISLSLVSPCSQLQAGPRLHICLGPTPSCSQADAIPTLIDMFNESLISITQTDQT